MPDFRDLLLPRLTLRYDFAEIGRRIMIKAQKAPREWRATKTAKRVAFYLRVSTGGQTTANQRRELAAVAKRHGWNVVNVFSDNGSGAKDRKALILICTSKAWTRPRQVVGRCFK